MKKGVIWAFLLLAFASCAWGACSPYSSTAITSGGTLQACDQAYANRQSEFVVCSGLFVQNGPQNSDFTCNGGGGSCTSCRFVSDGHHFCGNQYNPSCTWQNCVKCATQAEADSVKCAFNPTAQGCVVEKDTTLYFCKSEMPLGAGTSGGWKSYIFKCSCKAANGEITTCNGKTNVDVTQDCEPYKSMDGDCAQNGYPDGVGGEADSLGANAECFASFGGDCYMRDKRTGNTFTCACDGSCQVALRNLMAGNAHCTNPYPQSSASGDSVQLPPPSSSSWEPPSSSSTEDIGGSFGTELEGLSGLYGVLDTIRDTLVRSISPNIANIRANTQEANTYLQQIANKQWSVNVEAPDVHVTNNTDVSGIQSRQDRQYNSDTAYQNRVLNALGALNDTAGAGNPNDTAGSGAALQSRLDKIDSAVGAFDVPDMGDSIAPTLQAVRGDVAAMRDSITGGVIGDSVNAWKNAFLNNGVLAGDGSNSCPAVLTRQVSFTFPHVGTIQAGTLGRYLCAPIAGFSVTLWQVARMLLRAMVAIGCMWWLFKEVTGTTTGGGNDDD